MDFYRALSEHYDEIFPLKEPQRKFLQDYLKKEKLTSVLDIGCGTGTFALEISQRGVQVLGIDLSKEMIEISKRKAEERKSSASFAVADMRDLSQIQEGFQGILCLGNTLAHVSGERELNQVLAQFRQKGTLLLLQTVNYDRILTNQVKELPVIKTPQLAFYRYYNYRGDGNIDFSMKIEFPNRSEIISGVNRLFPLTSSILKKSFQDNHWEIKDIWGTYDKTPWSESAEATIIAARRMIL
ncbi:methyltransferase family protein [Desulfosporosinus orientis DSM 765]|uniref:Methyltransferase family protein n=1 Tax=Desulfosporosinus orientis (strain ATCC 19365 / DSM 765 / NCIMB 8382 / VKM B-1628 / Singapore I) TaxID=768706 RepID=G7WDR3_DESOD|nr:class I SAM-dependent methyltransferase [Desulfosporosinus orientis]AET68820.1 methyltransferase family protein [Desulfosporosinus orientis DSM 765]